MSETIEALSAWEWRRYGSVCELLPGDVVVLQQPLPAHGDFPAYDTEREWVVSHDTPQPIRFNGTVILISPSLFGEGVDRINIASRHMLRMVRRPVMKP